jgi:HSP20 family protein
VNSLLSRCGNQVSPAGSPAFEDYIYDHQTFHLGHGVYSEIVANCCVPGWNPGTKPLADVRFEIAETDKAFEVVAELPGLEDKDVEVTLANGLLTIRGEKQDTREHQTGKNFVVSERRYGSFERSFRVPEDIDEVKVTSRIENGVLTLTLPRMKTVEARAPRKIEIKKT